MASTIDIPASVPADKQKEYIENFSLLTRDSGRLMLFAGDQKVEHLNDDYYGEGIAADNNTPKHMFEIASKARIGCFATQLGLIAQYGKDAVFRSETRQSVGNLRHRHLQIFQ